MAPRRIALQAVVYGTPLAVGLVEAIRGAWISDDVLATFAAKSVAVSPHFLWLTLVSALHGAGLDLGALLRYLPIVCWAGVLAVLVAHATRAPLDTERATRGRDTFWLRLPVAAWGLALHRDAQIYASGGLEVALFALLLTGGLFVVVNHPRQNGLGAALYALCALVRPEGFVYSAVALAFVFWRGGPRRGLRFIAVWGALVLPHLLRTLYEGNGIHLMPTGSGPAAWPQGWAYTSDYFRVYPILLVCALGAVAAWIVAVAARRAHGDPRTQLVLVASVQIVLTVLLVTRGGGDPAFARAYIAVTPLLYLVAEETIRIIGRGTAMAGFAAIVLALTLGARGPREQFLETRPAGAASQRHATTS